jgi:hypothetical protein
MRRLTEVEDEDSSKEYYVRNGLHFSYAKLLISSSSTSSKIIYILFSYIFYLQRTSVKQLALKESNINNILQDVQKTMKTNLFK